MNYVVVVLLSLVLSFLGFFLQITHSNIIHLENGREPNAGASIMPTIPCGQVFCILVMWGLDQVKPNLGLIVCVVYFGFYTAYWCVTFPRETAKFRRMVADRRAEDSDP